ncbi:MAG: hypothetical protein R3F11_16475 [Verrucomicrobiales bacterium]
MIARLLLLLLVLPPLAAPWAIPLGVAQEGGARPAPAIVLKGEAESERAPHGGGNIYAPDVHRVGGGWRMWYGGQGRDGHDRIHLAESRDGTRWEKRGVVLDNGGANHVNDPSVVRAGGQWWMFYTVAESAEDDAIAAATSMDGIRWEKRGVVLAPGAGEAWDSRKVGRPSALYDAGRFRLWFDGQPTDSRRRRRTRRRRATRGARGRLRGIDGRVDVAAAGRAGLARRRGRDPRRPPRLPLRDGARVRRRHALGVQRRWVALE